MKLPQVGREDLLPISVSDETAEFALSIAQSSAERRVTQDLSVLPQGKLLEHHGSSRSGLAWGRTFRFCSNYLLF